MPQTAMGRGYTQYSYPDDDTPDEYAVYSAFLDYVLVDGSRLREPDGLLLSSVPTNRHG